MDALSPFREIWCADFEFRAPDGERPAPHCVVAYELRTGRAVRLFGDELDSGPPWYPLVAPLRELRFSLSQLRLNSLAVGTDGRNRCLLSAFRSTTGRNQPSNAKFIFGPSCWLRALIQPAPGRAVAYVDWEQQEFGIAAALSGDAAMQDAYASGDPYLTFAKQAGAVPPDAAKESHKAERDQFKVCALAVQYGMGEQSLAQSIGKPEAYARELLRLHRQTYPRFWVWSQAAVDHAMLHGWLQTVFGWCVHVGADANPRSLANFPMQANGAEMLRLACCLATEAGITVCAPVHDALLIEADAETIDVEVCRMQAVMQEASEIVLAGFSLRTDAKVTRLRAVRRAIDADGLTITSQRSGLQRAHPLLAHETALRKQFLDLWHRSGLQSTGGPALGGLSDYDMALLGAIAPEN